jgi:hypothetical protein
MAQRKGAVNYVFHQTLWLSRIYVFDSLSVRGIQKSNPKQPKLLQNFYQNVVFLLSGGFDVGPVK